MPPALQSLPSERQVVPKSQNDYMPPIGYPSERQSFIVTRMPQIVGLQNLGSQSHRSSIQRFKAQ